MFRRLGRTKTSVRTVVLLVGLALPSAGWSIEYIGAGECERLKEILRSQIDSVREQVKLQSQDRSLGRNDVVVSHVEAYPVMRVDPACYHGAYSRALEAHSEVTVTLERGEADAPPAVERDDIKRLVEELGIYLRTLHQARMRAPTVSK